MDIEKVRALLKEGKNKKEKMPFYKSFVIRVMLSIILFLGVLITIKSTKDGKSFLNRELFEKNFNFASVNTWYKETFGGVLPFDNIVPGDLTPVFHSDFVYTDKNKYLDGVSVTVEENYLVPIIESGTVVFIGEKEGYGNVVIIQQVNGVDLWYGNITNLNVNLYDYVEKGTLLGECLGSTLYLVYEKEGQFVNYEEYLS